MQNIYIGLLVGIALIGFITLITIAIRVAVLVSETSAIVKSSYISINKIEQMCQSIIQATEAFANGMNQFVEDNNTQTRISASPAFQIFRTEDGKHTGSTLEELMENIKQERDRMAQIEEVIKTVKKEKDRMSEADIEELKKFFGDNSDDDNGDESSKF